MVRSYFFTAKNPCSPLIESYDGALVKLFDAVRTHQESRQIAVLELRSDRTYGRTKRDVSQNLEQNMNAVRFQSCCVSDISWQGY